MDESDYQLRKRLKQVISDLGLEHRYTIHDIQVRVLTNRRRRLEIYRVSDLPIEFTGLWAATPTCDVIMCPSQASQAHIEHIILHEIAHMLLGHRPTISGDAAIIKQYLEQVKPDAQAVQTRGAYDQRQEVEAEELALLLAAKLDHTPTNKFWGRIRDEESPTTTHQVLKQIDDLLSSI